MDSGKIISVAKKTIDDYKNEIHMISVTYEAKWLFVSRDESVGLCHFGVCMNSFMVSCLTI